MFDDFSDADLIAQCRSGRMAAWSTLVRRFQRLIYTVPRRAGLGDDDCAEVFQSTFALLVEHLDQLNDPSRVRAWLVTTARRETLRRLELQARQGAAAAPRSDEEAEADADALAQVPDDGPLPDESLDRLQQHHLLRRALDSLDVRTRQFLELQFLQDEPLPYAEIARRLGLSEGSIGPTRARCLEKLRVALMRMR